ncbi:MAG: HAD family hydrolase, partial [Acidimicrobiales bacterium]
PAQVYQQKVAGKPRMSGACAVLEHFGVPDTGARAIEYADRKQTMVLALIEAGDFRAYPDALRFILAVRDHGTRVAAASSSKNAGFLLRQIRIDEFARSHGIVSPSARPGLTLFDVFDVDVSGRDFAHGKPHPEMFLAAATELRVDPQHAVVVEDAPAGIEAAKAGGMTAIGVARADDAALLAGAGANLVVTTLDEVDVEALAAGRLVTTNGAPARP